MEDKVALKTLKTHFIEEFINGRVKAIMAQRERIIEAFIAETGLKPSEIEIVEAYFGDEKVWYLRRREAKEGSEVLDE